MEHKTGMIMVSRTYWPYPERGEESPAVAKRFAWGMLGRFISETTTIMDGREYKFKVLESHDSKSPKPPYDQVFYIKAELLLGQWADAEVGEAVADFGYQVPNGDTFHTMANGYIFTREHHYWRRVE